MITSIQGIILEYNPKENQGKIQLIDNRIIDFQISICNNMEIWLKEDIIAEFENEQLISIKPDVEKQKSYFNLAFKPIHMTNHPFPQKAHDEKWKPELQKSYTFEEFLKLFPYCIWGENAELE